MKLVVVTFFFQRSFGSSFLFFVSNGGKLFLYQSLSTPNLVRLEFSFLPQTFIIVYQFHDCNADYTTRFCPINVSFLRHLSALLDLASPRFSEKMYNFQCAQSFLWLMLSSAWSEGAQRAAGLHQRTTWSARGILIYRHLVSSPQSVKCMLPYLGQWYFLEITIVTIYGLKETDEFTDLIFCSICLTLWTWFCCNHS